MWTNAGRAEPAGQYGRAIRACAQNAARLLDDARELREHERFEAAFQLAILAQEECAKAFILGLINDGVIEWTKEVEKATRTHECKHLIGIIMQWLNPSFDEVSNRWKQQLAGAAVEIPNEVAGAVNVLLHEKIGRWISKNWSWSEDPQWDKQAVKIGDGLIERQKQRAVYTEVREDGTFQIPKVSATDAEDACHRAEQMLEIADGPVMSVGEHCLLKESMRAVFGNLMPSAFNAEAEVPRSAPEQENAKEAQ